MFRKLFMIAAIAVLMSPLLALAEGVIVEKDEMVSILSGYHGGPAADYWSRLDSDAATATLKSIIEDNAIFPVARARALAALQYVDKGAGTYLGQRASAEKNGYIRASAYNAYANATGASGVEKLSEALGDSNTMVRIMAARNLSRIGNKDAVDALERALQTEKNITTRSVIKKSISRMR